MTTSAPPCKGKNKPASQKAANRVHAKLRGPVAVISGRTDKVTRTVTVGIDPTGIATDHVTNTVFTANPAGVRNAYLKSLRRISRAISRPGRHHP